MSCNSILTVLSLREKYLERKLRYEMKHPEADLQREAVKWMRENLPDMIIFSVPNEACFRRVNYFRDLGMLKGVSDVIVVGLEQVIFIEFKSETGRLSTEQRKFKAKVESLGHTHLVIRYMSDLKHFFGFPASS